MDFLCTFLQYSSLRGPRNSTTISSCFHPEGAPKGTKGLKNGSCGQWLTPVQSTRQKRGGNGDPAQAVTAERGCRATGRGVWESSSRRAAGFAPSTELEYVVLVKNSRSQYNSFQNCSCPTVPCLSEACILAKKLHPGSDGPFTRKHAALILSTDLSFTLPIWTTEEGH